jgi:hypothetical protein
MTREDAGQRNIYSSSGNFNSKTRLPQIGEDESLRKRLDSIPEVLKIDGTTITFLESLIFFIQ